MSKNFWDKIAGFYDFAESFNSKVYKEMTALAAGFVPQDAAVLDVAAGTGQLSFAAAEKAKEVVCTDLSLSMLENARKKAKRRNVTNILFEVRDIMKLTDRDNTYDVVIAGNVLHLLDEPQAAVKELYRVLKPGGRLLLPTFMLGGRKRTLVEIYRLLGFTPAGDYTEETYRKMLEAADCGAVKTKMINGKIPCCFAVMKKTAADFERGITP